MIAINTSLTDSLHTNPNFDRWLKFLPNKIVRVATGKVEIGQGVITAIAQIAAEELDLNIASVAVLSGDTKEGPDERYTSSSLSISVSGLSIRLVCAEARSLLLEQAALRLNCNASDLSVHDGAIFQKNVISGLSYWDVENQVDWSKSITGRVRPKKSSEYKIVGQSVRRADLAKKIFGSGFIHDFAPAGMLHARIVRQPGRDAVLHTIDEEGLRHSVKNQNNSEIQILRLNNFIAILGRDEATVEVAAAVAPAYTNWKGARRLKVEYEAASWLRGQPSILSNYGESSLNICSEQITKGTFSRPYLAHASLGPSCALALFENGHLTVWSHGQGMHPLRKNISEVLGLKTELVTALHMHGAGCYGHNGADDAALDAALIAMEQEGEYIRLQWRREEEFGFEPLGPAMLVDISAATDDTELPVNWTTEIWSPTHVQRPGSGSGFFLASEALSKPLPILEPQDPSEERGGGGTRNAVPYYDIPNHRILHHLVTTAPVRTSALRTLGGATNVFAIESLIDDLAIKFGRDPLDYRLLMLSDPRAKNLLLRVAEKSNWSEREKGGEGQGLGLAFSRYKNTAAYAACVVSLIVDDKIKLKKIWITADAGLVINPDGVLQQLEGGVMQGASWALKEQVRMDSEGITSLNWDNYPVIRFNEIPEIDSEVLSQTELPSLGVGECSVGPTIGAIGNALAHALNYRVRDMPFTREKIMDKLLT